MNKMQYFTQSGMQKLYHSIVLKQTYFSLINEKYKSKKHENSNYVYFTFKSSILLRSNLINKKQSSGRNTSSIYAEIYKIVQ